MKVIDEANQLIVTLKTFSKSLGDGITADDLKAAVDAHAAAVKRANEAKAAAVAASNDRSAATTKVAELITRIRSATRGVYGPDSTEYEQVGGVRKSERKPRSKSKAPK